jgi:hypothetical protein
MSGPLRIVFSKVGLAGLSALLCAGCAVTGIGYQMDRYGRAGATQIHLSCRDTYEVLDRPDANSMLVVTNSVNEAIALCEEGVSALPKDERLRRVARIFFEEAPGNRSACRITGETPLSLFQTEFSYNCNPVVPPAAARRPRR